MKAGDTHDLRWQDRTRPVRSGDPGAVFCYSGESLQSMLPQRLKDGYLKFRSGLYRSEAERYRSLAETGQQANIMVIACCDSRAAPEAVFDAGPGELFVVRNVANLVPPYAPDGGHHATSAALEFGVLSLGVSAIVVMGHGRCGGIKAALSTSDPLSSTDFIGSWVRSVKDVAQSLELQHPHGECDPLRDVEQASVEHSLANLRTFPWIRQREARKALSLHGAWFDISLGELHVYDSDTANWQPLQHV